MTIKEFLCILGLFGALAVGLECGYRIGKPVPESPKETVDLSTNTAETWEQVYSLDDIREARETGFQQGYQAGRHHRY